MALLLEKLGAGNIIGPDSNKMMSDVKKIGQKLVKGSNIKPTELLHYQMRMNETHLKVEMASKLTESVSGTLKRLQNG